jgi:branched-chain amino acid transport system substrate-binding protein
MKMKKLLLLSIALIIVLAGCSSKSSTGATGSGGSSAKVIKIGTLHPLSGSMANEGQQMRDAVRLAADEVNKAGGIKSLGGAKIQVVEGDSQGVPEKGVSEIQRLNREGVVGIIGAYSSGVTLPATQEAEKAKIPFVVDIATDNSITERGFKYTFRIQPPASVMAKNFLNYINVLNKKAATPLKTVVLAHEDSVFGTGIANLIAKDAASHGLKVLADIPHPATAADLSSTVNKIKSLNPDIVVSTSYLQDGTLLVNGLKDANFQPKAMVGVANGAYSNAQFITQDKATNQYIMDINYTINPKSDLATTVEKEYKQAFNKDLGPNAAYSYTAAKVLIDAIERAGSTDHDKIREALTKTNLKGHILPQGPIVFDSKGQNENSQAVLNQIIDGQSKVVYPNAYKDAEPIYPTKK